MIEITINIACKIVFKKFIKHKNNKNNSKMYITCISKI